MGKAPAFQFYPSDWTRDLDEHPLEIEGAWIRICCKLWWEENRGTATKALTKWARILRTGEKKCLSIVTYLHKQKIADVVIEKDAITITSRRMVRDDYIRRIRSAAGIKGGNPLLRSASAAPVLDKQTELMQNETPSSSVSSSSSEKEMQPAAAAQEVCSVEFEAFWAHYPRKTAKKAAFAQWRKAVDRPPADAIIEALLRQKRHKAALQAAGRFCSEWPDPERYIRKRRWEDEIPAPQNDGNGAWVPREYVAEEPVRELSEAERQENLRRVRALAAALK